MDIFKANKSILKMSGLLTNVHKSFVYKVYGFLVALYGFLFLIPLSINIFRGNISDLTILSIQIAYSFEAAMTFIKVILFMVYNKDIFKIIDKLQANVDLSNISNFKCSLNLTNSYSLLEIQLSHKMYYIQAEEDSNRLTKTYLKLLIAAGFTFLMEPILQATFNYLVFSVPFINIPFPIRAL